MNTESKLLKIEKEIKKRMSPEERRLSNKERRADRKVLDKQRKKFESSIFFWFNFLVNNRFDCTVEDFKFIVKKEERNLFVLVCGALNLKFNFETTDTDFLITSVKYEDLKKIWQRTDEAFAPFPEVVTLTESYSYNA